MYVSRGCRSCTERGHQLGALGAESYITGTGESSYLTTAPSWMFPGTFSTTDTGGRGAPPPPAPEPITEPVSTAPLLAEATPSMEPPVTQPVVQPSGGGGGIVPFFLTDQAPPASPSNVNVELSQAAPSEAPAPERGFGMVEAALAVALGYVLSQAWHPKRRRG